MLRFKELSLALVLPLIAGISALLVSLCLLWLAATSSGFLAEQREQVYGESLAQQIADTVSNPLQRGDLLSARASIQRFIGSQLVGGIEIRDVEGMAMGAAGALNDGAMPQFIAPIQIGSDRLGEIVVSIDDAQGRESRFRFVFSLFALAAALSLLTFMLTRIFAQRLAHHLDNISAQLSLPETSAEKLSPNELENLRKTVDQLPLDMLRGHAEVPSAATNFELGNVVFVHLASLVRYVDTLSESNLHRYSRRLQQIVQAAANCYRGELSVSRPFGITIRFAPQSNAGSEALRAASCARLIASIADALSKRTNLSLDLAMAVGNCEQVAEDVDDIYPSLYLQGAIDELRDACLNAEGYPSILIATATMTDEQLTANASTQVSAQDGFQRLDRLATEQEALIDHQAKLIVERIKPSNPAANQ